MNPAYLTAPAPMRQPRHVYTSSNAMPLYRSYSEAPESPPGSETESQENRARLNALPKPPRRKVFGELQPNDARINNSALHAREPTAQHQRPTHRQVPEQNSASDQRISMRETGPSRRDSILRPAARRPVSAILAERLAA